MKRDTENIPLTEKIDDYFEREILSFIPDAWIDKKKNKIGYEIPFTRAFFEFGQQKSADILMKEIEEIEKELQVCLAEVLMK